MVKPETGAKPGSLLAGVRAGGLLPCAHAPAKAGKRRPRPTAQDNGRRILATAKELADFLASVERRAFKQAVFAIQEEEAALDAVQDAMLKLAENYAARPAAELPLLFQRILQNGIRDHFRRQKVRSTWTTRLSSLGLGGEDDDADPLEALEVEDDANVKASPADQLEQAEVMAVIEEAIKALPERQREAFLLRYWEEFDVSETARAMGCSEGSVKTHCSRATHALAKILRSKGITL